MFRANIFFSKGAFPQVDPGPSQPWPPLLGNPQMQLYRPMPLPGQQIPMPPRFDAAGNPQLRLYPQSPYNPYFAPNQYPNNNNYMQYDRKLNQEFNPTINM